MRHLSLITAVTLLPLACGGQNNVADCDNGQAGVPCSALTTDEQADQALNNGNYDDAVALYTELVTEQPTAYRFRTLLGASYAARAGFDIFKVVTSSFGGGGSLFDQIATFLPDPVELGAEGYKVSVGSMGSAVSALQGIPADLRGETSGEAFAKSASLMLTLYQSAYSVMYLNQFAVSASTGAFDPAQLATMTEEDALIVINNLAAAGALQSNNPELQAQITATLAEINGQEGGTTKDKLAAFVSKQQTPAASPPTE